jgi:poly(3-hydroxybutyrate) depolymerase
MRQLNFYFLLLLSALFLSSLSLKAQIEDFKVGTTTRKMLVYAPPGIESNRPLLISMHGLNQDITYQQNQTKWEDVAKANSFVVVYPGGISNSWDISGTRDTDFILAIIDEMAKRYRIDRDRVYLSGFSMGGMMTYHAATKIADKIAAFAPVSGYLMGGPNTKSSRPIPIIHTHGTTDDVVVYSGVQRHMDAWIARNNCPKTAVITKPYPVSKPSSTASKYYWGPGTDSVEIVLLSLPGKGHWHSNDGNGVHTSQEIWNFCKKFSLGFGVSKFKSASVTSQNPKQVQIEYTLPIKQLDNYEGFSVKIDGELVAIDSIALADSIHMSIYLADSILNSNDISVSYANGNVVSTYDKKLPVFDNKLVENMLDGAPPRIVEISASENGNVLVAKFSKNMLLPTDISSLKLTAQGVDTLNISISECVFLNNDSTAYAFTLGERVYADYKLLLTYSGSNFSAADSSLVKNFTDYLVVNKSTGLPVQVVSGALETDALTLSLTFSKSMAMTSAQLSQIAFTVNGKVVSVKEINVLEKLIKFTLNTNLYFGDSIKATYTPGTIAAADKGLLQAFSNLKVENKLQEPVWHAVPGKVEAENYALQFGTDKENTSDVGGGQNVGWIENNDWLVYAIENLSDSTELEITFRLAAQAAGGVFTYYIDNVKLGQISVPNTGAWQAWQSVVKTISLPKGKHYLKLFANTGGFNVNFFEIKEIKTGNAELKRERISVYPNPVSSQLIVEANGLIHSKIEFFDFKGASVFVLKTNNEPVVTIPLNLPNGVYLVKIDGETQSETRKIQVLKD